MFDTFAALRCILLYFVLIGAGTASSQTDTMRLYQVYSAFSNQEKAEWTSFENNWTFYHYPKLKNEASVKRLSCKNCTAFYGDVYLEIDSRGRLVKATCIGGRCCGETLTTAMIHHFEGSCLHTIFQHIKNRTFIARFGEALKC